MVSFVLYALFSIGVLIYGTILVKAMNPDEIDLSVTGAYLRLETVAFMVGIIISYVNVVFVVLGKDKNVYIFLIVRTVLSLIADFVLIPRFGVYGVAVSNIIVNVLLSAVCILMLFLRKNIKLCRFGKADGEMFRDWSKTGVFSGAQQFLDNFIYAVMVCKMVNMVAEQGNYWIANNYSLIINLIYYGVFYILYITDAVAFSMNTIILMFGFGMVVHLVISLIEEKVFLKKSLLKARENLL